MKYAFDEFEIHVEQRRLSKSDVVVSTEPKVFDVLLYLIENRDRVVSRDELLDNCWPNIYVGDGTLSRCLSRVREALDQKRAAKSPVQTIHSKGYMFTAELTEENEDDVETQAPAPALTEPADGPVFDRYFVSVLHAAFSSNAKDEEGAHRRALAFSRTCRDIAAAYDCEASLQSGSEVTVVVGYPKPIEHPANVAIMIASEMLDCARGENIGMRASIASGPAIVDMVESHGQTRPIVFGVEPARVVGEITGDVSELFLDDRTAQLASDSIAAERVERRLATGAATDIHQVHHRHAPKAARMANAAPPFVGRDRELIHLEDLWSKAGRGSGQIVVVSGEPGIGKSALVEEFLVRAAVPDSAVLKAQCSPYHVNTPFNPLMILLREILDVELESPPLKMLQAIEEFLEKTDQPATDHLPLLASLLTVSNPSRRLPDLSISAKRQRERTMEAVLFMMTSAARTTPTLVWVDDAQWADPSTKKTLARLVKQTADLNLMVVLCYRDEDDVDLPGLEDARRFPLERMQKSQCVRLLSDLSERGLLPSGLIEVISDRSAGVPLYLREIVRMATASEDQAAGLVNVHAVPDSLKGLLATRLNLSGAAREIVQWGSVIGKGASRELLSHVSELPEDALSQSLQDLLDAGIFQAEERGGVVEYRFAHALMRDAAYDSMLVGAQREHHLKVAEMLRMHFPQVAASEPERVAIHFAASTKPSRAAEYWQAAGAASVEKHALDEALALFRQALDAAKAIPEEEGTSTLIAEVEEMLAAF